MAMYHDALATHQNYGRAVEFVKRALRKAGARAIAFTGMSGSSVGFAAAHALCIPWCYVRKDHENAHGSTDIETAPYTVHLFRKYGYVFVDDFLSTGATFSRVTQKMWEANVFMQQYHQYDFPKDEQLDYLNAKCVGIVQYKGDQRSCIDNRNEDSPIHTGTYHVPHRYRHIEELPMNIPVFYPPYEYYDELL